MKTPILSSINHRSSVSRRHFLHRSSIAAAGTALASRFPLVSASQSAPDAPIRIGVIGCGGRGTGAVLDALGAATEVVYPNAGYHTEDVASSATVARQNIKIVALADVFPDRLERCRAQLKKLNIEIGDEYCFLGFESYRELLGVDEINYVILATPPHFRPEHLRASIDAGKHVFMEKPVAVDGPGIRTVLAAAEMARQKKLGIVGGTQRRHQPSYQETLKRLQDGAIGEIAACYAYWNGGVIWVVERRAGWSDMEWQLRNWNYFTWLSGDHIVEQHVHNLDIINWVMNDHPVRAYGMGGRQARPNDTYGHIYDHFAVEYEYPNGVRLSSQCRQMNGCDGRVAEAVVGTKGTSNCQNMIRAKDGSSWRFRGAKPNPYQQEHVDLINGIRTGNPPNEARAIAESTLTAIMGRESAYSGRTVEWNAALNSKIRLGPAQYELGDLAFPKVAIPGEHRFS